ncbi:MAG TPA: 50S ribosomal protein L18e [Candidatus Methanoperedenaceae archaeon]|nr:50S ribosomal protein L18e [Candidatus Methanoperedenaceae archaeon]
MKEQKKTNPQLVKLIGDLKAKSREANTSLWHDVALRLERPTRNFSAVNLSKISRHSSKHEAVLVPGKVLGTGDIDHPVIVAALGFSTGAASKIQNAGGACITIEQLMSRNPKGSKVRVMG